MTQSCWSSCTSVDIRVTTSTGAYFGEPPPCWEAHRYVTLSILLLYLQRFFPHHFSCAPPSPLPTRNHILPTMEFFTWCMAYPCPYGPCNPSELEEWKQECEAIHEKRRQKKELKRLKRPILQCEGYVNCHDVKEKISWLWTTIKRCKTTTIAKIARDYDTQMYATR